MIDKNFTHRTGDAIHAVARWIMKTARDIHHASSVLQRIQYDRPWDTLAHCGEGVSPSGRVNRG